METDLQNPDAALWVKFYTTSVKNEHRSAAEGHPCFDDKIYISIITPGQADKIERPIKDSDKQRFVKQWLNFQAGASEKIEGTPVVEWPQVTRAQADELKYLGVHSVEQLAAASDGQVQKLMGGVSLREKAKAFLAIAKNTAEGQRIAAENKNLRDEIEALKAQVAQLGAVKGTPAIPKRRGRPPKLQVA